MSLKEPIVEGAWYETNYDIIVRAESQTRGYRYHADGSEFYAGEATGTILTRRVYIVPTDPAEVVAALRKLSQVELLVTELRDVTGDDPKYTEGTRDAYSEAADLVAENLGVK